MEVKNLPEPTESPIIDFLRGKTVFVTGGLGFVGKLLIEKLLRCDVRKIFIMARPKKGKSMEERLEALYNEPIFEKLSKDKARDFAKLELIYGDLQKLNLGIAPDDERRLINEVEILYHCAANVRFDESLKVAVETNVRGMREIINLARRVTNLNVFVFVSTAFCTPSFDVKEKFYDTSVDPFQLVKYVESLRSPQDIKRFEIFAPRFIQPHSNTYTFTKSLSEQIMKKMAGNLNCAIVRPAIITVTYVDPIEGFTDNIYGMNGMFAGGSAGLLRVVLARDDFKANIVPADHVVNLIAAVSYYTMTLENNNFNFSRCNDNENLHQSVQNETTESDDRIKVYNFSSFEKNYVTWRYVMRITTRLAHKMPIMRNFGIIAFNTTRHRWIAKILTLIYHVLPALIFDGILRIRRKQPKVLKLYRKVNKFAEVLTYFAKNQWHFDESNVIHLWNIMTPYDKKMFQFNLWSIDWEHFFGVYVRGMRRYIHKEDDLTMDLARKRYRNMTVVHYLMLSAICAFVIYCAYKILVLYGILHDLPEHLISLKRFCFP